MGDLKIIINSFIFKLEKNCTFKSEKSASEIFKNLVKTLVKYNF